MNGYATEHFEGGARARTLTDVLIKESLITDSDLRNARRLQAESGGQLLDMLVRIGAIDEDALLSTAERVWKIQRVLPEELPTSKAQLDAAIGSLKLSEGWMKRHQVMVWFGSGGKSDEETLRVGASNPLDPNVSERLSQAIAVYATEPDAKPVEWRVVSKIHLDMVDELRADAHADQDIGASSSLSRLMELAEEAPIIDLVNQVLTSAIRSRASDIHIEPSESNFEVRFRVDGVMQTWQRFPKSKFDATSTRIKLISKMDIAERRLPQDGRQSIRLSGRSFDLRVSSLPGAWGESLVLRLLPKDQTLPGLQDLGLTGRSLKSFSGSLRQANGIVLVTGPTGSGKSTTLYTGLQSVNDGDKKIITIEDPIEFNMEKVTQIQVKSDIGLTFASGLRSILRQDPDIIMIGEIRDPETARIAIQASLTGHLVLSTLHTNSALLAIPRLRDLGLENFQIGAAVKGLAAQRLVRRVCDECAEPHVATADAATLTKSCDVNVLSELQEKFGEGHWRLGKGCEACGGTGYRGRLALFEIVAIDGPVREAILSGEGSSKTELAARQQGFRSLVEDGLEKAMSGLTTASEVMRVVTDVISEDLRRD